MRAAAARAAAALALAALTAGAPATGRAAGQARFAVVVGANHGEPGEEGLLYAERDAARVAHVLARFATVPEENLVLLRGASAGSVERVLQRLQRRVAEAREDGRESLVFLYYSGHADAQAMHLGASRLAFHRARELLDATGAQLRVVIVDACRSGDLIRTKGAVPAEPFEIDAEDRLASEGTAVITSSAAGEDAQESDRLKGGIFTHHLVTGLLGAADSSDDQRVTLSEAYRYTYLETLRTTSRARFVQHPSYSFRMHGRQDLVLTRLTGMSGLGRLELAPPGTYVLLPSGGRGSVAELSTDGGVRVLLEPGRYVVRRRTDEAVWEATATVKGGEVTTVTEASLTPVPYGTTVRKGYSARERALSVTASLSASGAWLQDTQPGTLGTVGIRLDLPSFTVEGRIRYGRTSATNETLDMTQDAVGLDLGLLKLFDYGVVAPGFGLRLGADGVQQRFDTDGVAPTRTALAGRATPLVRLEVAPTPWLAVSVDVGADLYLLPDAATSDGPTLQAAPTAGAGVTVFLP